ncbi:MAG: RDD family protein [Candidatus Bathyarchaeota archaeon]|nr:RDD family protein [Candidatus Bathyarchaeota archaeon]
MPFCPRCGKEVPVEANYCPHCGSHVREGVDRDQRADTGLGLLMADSGAQRNWLSRIAAYVIDSIVVGVAALVVGWLLTFPLIFGPLLRGNWWTWRGFIGLPFSLGVIQVFYFSLMERGYGSSIGKQALGLMVVDEMGKPPSFSEALIRNLSKIYWALLLLDILLGLITRFDPRQKYTDQIAGTKIISLRGSHRSRHNDPPIS